MFKDLDKYNKMTTINYLTLFNSHFIEFLEDMERVFPEDLDIKMAKNSVLLLKKGNPKLLIGFWKTYVVATYKDQIEKGDIDFFISKDYSNDLAKSNNSEKIMEIIDRIREPIKQMSPESKQKTIQYIQNLTKLSNLYN